MFRVCKYIIVIFIFAFSLSTQEGYSWEDPFAKEKPSFDDPWNKKQSYDPWSEKDTKTDKTPSSDQKKGTQTKKSIEENNTTTKMEQVFDSSSDKKIKNDPMLQDFDNDLYMKDQYVSPQKKMNKKDGTSTKLEDLDDIYSDYVPEHLTPFGLGYGDSTEKAYNYLVQNGMIYAGQCNGGSYFVMDPQNLCMGILIMGQKDIRGTTTYISQQCLESDSMYAAYEAFAKSGKKVSTGWIVSNKGSDITSCLAQSVVSNDDIPRFLGYVHENMFPDVVDAVLIEQGSVKVKDFRNGKQYSLHGSTIWYEFCESDGKMLSITIDVKKEHPIVRKLIDDMKLHRNIIQFQNGIIQTKKTKGIITSVEYVFTNNVKKCKKQI